MIKFMFAVMLLLVCAAAVARAYECDSPTCPEECPVGSFYYTNFSGLEFCVFDGIKLPAGAAASCGEVAPTIDRKIGWIGYSFPLAGNGGHQCSAGFSRAADTGGRGLCVAAAWPAHAGVFSYCGYLTSGCDPDYGCYEGYGWPSAALLRAPGTK
jgi:hypothetical protein